MPALAETVIKPQPKPKIPLPSISVDLPIDLSVDLPIEDGEPLESNSHRMAMTALIHSLKHAYADRPDVFIGGNMFVYFSQYQLKNTDYRGPDFFVVLDTIKNDDREAWYTWEEGGRTPNMVIELLSKTTRAYDLTEKKSIYEQTLKTEDYFVFDPLYPDYFRGWHLVNGRYQELQPNENGWLWAESLGLWIGVWFGQIEEAPQSRRWLRFYDTDGQLLLLPDEDERLQKEDERLQKEIALQQVEEERQRVEQLMKLLRAQGVNTDEIDF